MSSFAAWHTTDGVLGCKGLGAHDRRPRSNSVCLRRSIRRSQTPSDRRGKVIGMEGGWSPHPDAIDHEILPPAEPGRVVGIGAICDLGPPRPNDPYTQGFVVSEFVTLEGGRRVLLHKERGFTIGLRSTRESSPVDLRYYETPDSIAQDVLAAVLPDGEDPDEDHPWTWLADLARARGLNVAEEDLRDLTYEVILTDNVTRWLAST